VAIAPKLPDLHQRVYNAIVAAGGCTDAEGQGLTGIGGDTYRPRRVWLQDNGYIRDTGKTRPTPSGRLATVWGVA
jgi:hypothetical protein